MTFALSGSTITQGGIDTSLAGLSGIAGVTTIKNTSGYFTRTTYILTNLYLVINGTLTHDPKYEELNITNTALQSAGAGSFITINSGGVYNYGNSTNFIGSGLVFPTRTNDHWQAFMVTVNTGGTFNWSGAIITGANVGIVSKGGVINVNGGSVWGAIGGNYGGQNISGVIGVLTTGGTLNISNTLNGIGLSLNGKVSLNMTDNYTVSNISFKNGAQCSPYGTNGSYVRYIDCEMDIVTNPLIVTYYRINLFSNFKNGTNFFPIKVGAGQGQAQIEVYRNFNPTVKISGAVVANAVTYIKDVNNGNRKTFTLSRKGTPSNQDYVYITPTSATGKFASDVEIYVGSIYTGTSDVSDAYDTGTSRWDRRFSDVAGSTTNTDTGTLYVWEYTSALYSSNISFNGTVGTLSPDIPLLPDFNVTLSKASVAALTSAASLDNVYDLAKYWKTQNIQSNLEYPTIATQPITANASDLDFGARTLVLDGSAAAAFSINTSTNVVTLKASSLTTGTRFKSITCGTITLSNSATLTGITKNGGNLVVTSLSSLATIQNCEFISSGTGHAITVSGTAQDITFNGNTFTGYVSANGSTSNEAIFVNIATGTVNIKVTGGGNLPSIRTAGATVTVAYQSTVTFSGFPAGSDVVVLTAGTTTVLTSVDQNASTSWAWTYTGTPTVDVGFIKQGYVPFYIRNVALPATNSTIPVSLTIDRNYS